MRRSMSGVRREKRKKTRRRKWDGRRKREKGGTNRDVGKKI